MKCLLSWLKGISALLFFLPAISYGQQDSGSIFEQYVQTLETMERVTAARENAVLGLIEQGYAVSEAGGNLSPEFQFDIGQRYFYGDRLPKNSVEAAKWLNLAAQNSSTEAFHLLGFLYQSGEGVPQNYLKSYVYFSIAAALGKNDAVSQRDSASMRLTPEQLDLGQAMADQCFESSFDNC